MKNQELKNVKGSIDMNYIGKVNFKILNPGGNITALVNGCNYTKEQKRIINKMIMNKYPQVEQVGFLSNEEKRLEMAGGEFCMNATRCAIYEYAKTYNDVIEISVSGVNNKIRGKKLDDNIVGVKLDINKDITDLIEVKNDFVCIKLDGILIAILDEVKSKKYIKKLKEKEEFAKKELKEIMIKEINSEEKAIGIILLEKNDNKIKINPVVWVKDINTVFYETACGSGSLGVAIYNYLKNKEKKVKILQPSGYYIEIKSNIKGNYIKNVIVSGIVKEE